MHYLTPSHGLFWFIYATYFTAAFIVAYMARHSEEGRLRKVISGSFNDLRRLPWVTGVVRMVISNVIWPFQRYGVVGMAIAVVYWPLIIPLTLLVAVFYSLPTIYLTVRMCFYSRQAFLANVRKRPGRRAYRVHSHVDESMRMFYVESLCGSGCADNEDATVSRSDKTDIDDGEMSCEIEKLRQGAAGDKKLSQQISNTSSRSRSRSTVVERRPLRLRRVVEHITAAGMCILALLSCLIVLSECVGCLVEIAVFTTMGVIVNAGTLLKYVSLLILVVVYSYDSFNNVEKKYLKLNKALFGEVKGRIKNLELVTSQPAALQENCAFKSQELSEQAAYEVPDNLVTERRHWLINDLVLFVDNEDMPRIPRQLFDDVCQIRVAGVPGPVYRGLLAGLAQFLKIVVFIFFVFVVVLSFGEVYRVSSTNQMLATLAGGFLPVIMRQFMEPERPDIEIGTVKFRTKLDEVIKNFRQCWPLYDLPFTVVPDAVDAAKDDNKDHELTATSGAKVNDTKQQQRASDVSVRINPTTGNGKPQQLPQQQPQPGQDVDSSDPAPRSDVFLLRPLQTDLHRQTTSASAGYTANAKSLSSPADPLLLPTTSSGSSAGDRSATAAAAQGSAHPTPSNKSSSPPPPTYEQSATPLGFRPNLFERVCGTSTPREGARNSDHDKSVYFDVEEYMEPPADGRTTTTDGAVASASAATTTVKVDWLIILPDKFDDQWLDEWSDIVEYRKVAAGPETGGLLGEGGGGGEGGNAGFLVSNV
jgi:hypothetical protein